MTIRAALRVIPSARGLPRPEDERLQEAARCLERLGITVLRIGRFGVSVEANEDDFSRVLGVQRATVHTGTTSVNPPDSQLAALIDQVEIAPEAELYRR